MTGSHRTDPRPGRIHAIPAVAALLLAGAASIAVDQPAVSQQSSTAAQKPAATEIAPRGQREVKDIAYGDWKKLCFKPGGAKMICRTSITGTFATGQVAVRVDIVEVGMYLPKPAKLTIDQGTPYNVPYTWCLTNACIAGAVADPSMVKEMDSGQTLRLEFVDSSLLTLTTSLPLGQFASVHKGAPAQTFEQDIDE